MSSAAEARVLFVVEYRSVPADPASTSGGAPVPEAPWARSGAMCDTEAGAQREIDWVKANIAGHGWEMRIVRYEQVQVPVEGAAREMFTVEFREIQGEPASLLEEGIPEAPWRPTNVTHDTRAAAQATIDWLNRWPAERRRERRIVRYTPADVPEEDADTVHDARGWHDIDAVARQTPAERAEARLPPRVTFSVEPRDDGTFGFTIQVEPTQIFANDADAVTAGNAAANSFKYLLAGTPLDALVELAAAQARLIELNGGPLCPRPLPDQITSVVNGERTRAIVGARDAREALHTAREALTRINGGDLGTRPLAENIEAVFKGANTVNLNAIRLQRERAEKAEEKLARAVKGLCDFTYEGHYGDTDPMRWPCDGTCAQEELECADHLPAVTTDTDRCAKRDECSRCQALDLVDELAALAGSAP